MADMTETASTSDRVLPVTTDHDTAPFWAAAARGELVVRWCGTCERPVHLPKAFCSRCHQMTDVWKPVSGRARVHSWTTVEHQVHPGHPTPYTVVVVTLDDEPEVRLLGSLPGRAELSADQPMEVWFEQVDDVTLPQWRPVA